jgi:histidinol-phosphatase (PHP family)
MCRTAFEKGLVAIGFSAHAPIEKTGLESTWHMKDERLGEYIDEINAARLRWEGRIAVYLGLEVDYIKGLRSALDDDIKKLGLDYIIGSVHYLVPSHGAPFAADGTAEEMEKGIAESYGGDGEAMMNAYWDVVAEMIALGGFDIIGHLDLIKRNNNGNRLFDRERGSYIQRTEEIARAVSAGGLVTEVNTGGLNRGYFNETCPSQNILRLLRQHNAPVVITADAHKAGDLDGNYQTARQTLLDAGYTEHVLFAGRKDGKPVWNRVKMTRFSGLCTN